MLIIIYELIVHVHVLLGEMSVQIFTQFKNFFLLLRSKSALYILHTVPY